MKLRGINAKRMAQQPSCAFPRASTLPGTMTTLSNSKPMLECRRDCSALEPRLKPPPNEHGKVFPLQNGNPPQADAVAEAVAVPVDPVVRAAPGVLVLADRAVVFQ